MTSDRDRAERPTTDREPARDTRRRRSSNVVVGVLVALVVVGVVVAAALLGGGTGRSTGASPDDSSQEQEQGREQGQEEGQAQGEAGDQPPGPCPPGVGPVADPVQLEQAPPPVQGAWTVTMETTCGPITMELDGDAAPVGVGSFVGLVQAGFYDGTPCHRLTTSGIFVLQCGDPTGTGTGGPGYSYGPVENAPADDVYPAGTVAMARVGNDGESMGSQFFLVYEDSTIPSDAAGGYTVLGRILEGLETVRLVAEGGLAEDGVAPARSTGIVSVTAEESA